MSASRHINLDTQADLKSLTTQIIADEAVGNLQINSSAAIDTSKLADADKFLFKDTSTVLTNGIRFTYGTSQTFSNPFDLVTKEYVDAQSGGGGGTPGGLTTQVQINNSSAFYGDALFTFDPVTKYLAVGGPTWDLVPTRVTIQRGAGDYNLSLVSNDWVVGVSGAAIAMVADSSGATGFQSVYPASGLSSGISLREGYVRATPKLAAGSNGSDATSTLQSFGSLAVKVDTVNDDAGIPEDDCVIICDASAATGGDAVFDLPQASTIPGQIYIFKKTDASANTVTITPFVGDTIDGVPTFVLYNQNDSVTIISSYTTNWFTISKPSVSSGNPVTTEIKDIDFTAADADIYVLDLLNNSVTMTFPLASASVGVMYLMTAINADVNSLTFTASGADILNILGIDQTTQMFPAPGSAFALKIFNDGIKWYIRQ